MVYKKNTKPDHSHMFRHLADEISLEKRQKRLEIHTHTHAEQLSVFVHQLLEGQIIFPHFSVTALLECGVRFSVCKPSAGQSYKLSVACTFQKQKTNPCIFFCINIAVLSNTWTPHVESENYLPSVDKYWINSLDKWLKVMDKGVK